MKSFTFLFFFSTFGHVTVPDKVFFVRCFGYAQPMKNAVSTGLSHDIMEPRYLACLTISTLLRETKNTGSGLSNLERSSVLDSFSCIPYFAASLVQKESGSSL